MKRVLFPLVFMMLIIGAVAWNQISQVSTEPQYDPIDLSQAAPDWPAISAWPPTREGETATITADANPDPWQLNMLIILDDSGSMGGQMEDAKTAVIEAVRQLDPDSRVGVLALNAGAILPVMSAADAARELPGRLHPLSADGGTPLGARLLEAAAVLTMEARRRRGFGIYRILVTTDGVASDGDAMNRNVAGILSQTPIELATIGLGIGEGHALNVPGFTSYVSVESVADLANALNAAAAEQTTFQPITKFEE